MPAGSASVRVFVANTENRTEYSSVWDLNQIRSKKGLEIITIDGVPAFKAILKNALRFPELSKGMYRDTLLWVVHLIIITTISYRDDHVYLPCSDPSVNFNHQLLGSSYRARGTASETADLQHFVMNYTFSDGSSLSVPWAGAHLWPGKFGDCTAPQVNVTAAVKDVRKEVTHFRFDRKDAEQEPTSIINVS